jgi:hypothetical protein
VKLRDIAHTRAGDKGNLINISVIPYKESDYEFLKKQLTTDKVKHFFLDMCKGNVTRYEVDGLSTLNFVLEHMLDGGSSRNLGLDVLGRSTAQAILEIEI